MSLLCTYHAWASQALCSDAAALLTYEVRLWAYNILQNEDLRNYNGIMMTEKYEIVSSSLLRKTAEAEV